MDVIRNKLRTDLSKGSKAVAKQKKDHNIKVFSELSRNGLEFGKIERRVFLGSTSAGERLYIQYPGKESKFKDDKERPWDLRPKLQLKNGTFSKDISFKDIWDDLISLHEKDPEMLPILAAVFYRLCMLTDHKLVTERCEFEDMNAIGNVINKGVISLEHYRYSPDQDVVNYLSERIGNIGGMSYEAYMLVNDYLAQNEDCKYYYRDTVRDKKKWEGKIGRYNNLMTHIMIIAFLREIVRFTEVTDQFQRLRGVAPIQEKHLSAVSDGLIEYEKGEFRLG